MKPLTSDHVLRITRTLALVGSLSAVLGSTATGCGASVAPNDADTRDQASPPDVQTLVCVCCPSGDLSGRCAVTSGGSGDRAPLPADSGSGIAPPPPPLDASGEGPGDAGTIQPPPPFDAGEQPDASVTYLDPPAGQRWCTVNDLFPSRPNGPSCPVPGPLPPPSVDF